MTQANGHEIPAQLPSGPVRGARPMVAVRANGAVTLAPRDFSELWNLAHMLADGQFVPKAFAGKPGDVLAALMMGAEVGLSPLAALRGIAVINGRPSLWGDALLGVAMQHPDYVAHREWIEGEGDKMVACCIVVRRGSEPHTVRFSVDDAKKSKLWGKAGPWQEYPKRMLQLRARAWAIRDKFADALAGLASAEEVQDAPPEGVTVNVTAAPEPGKGRQSVVALPSRRAKTEEAPVVAEPEAAPPAAPQAAAEPEDRRTVAQLRAHALAQLARFDGESGDADRALFLTDFVAGAQDDVTRKLDSVQAVQACGYREPLVVLCAALDRAFGGAS